MKTKLLVSFGVALALSMTSIGCKQGEDTAADEPSQDGGGGGGGGGGTPTPTACTSPGSGNNPVSYGAFIDNATVGRTINSITVYLRSHDANATYNYTVTAHQCGLSGTQVASATISGTLTQAYNYYQTTITFGSSFNVADCAGKGTVAFKFTGTTSHNVYMGMQQYSGSACEMATASNASSTPPVLHPGGYAYSGTVQ